VQGFGDFLRKDKYIMIKNPFITQTEIWTGFLEGLLAVKLDAKNSTPTFVFEMKG
jgi:hypothetical protein